MITEPVHLELKAEHESSLMFRWDAPECGGPELRYDVLLVGKSNYALFDMHRNVIDGTLHRVSAFISRSVTKKLLLQFANLLPGTTYELFVRAIDADNNYGPWSSLGMQATTKGERKFAGGFVLCGRTAPKATNHRDVIMARLP